MAKIRVIAGSARGTKLKLVPGDVTRPITDRVKESLFNIIQPDIKDCVFWDLFAGTGSVGIEALSRGAKFARMVDQNKMAVKTIRENLAITGLEANAEVIQVDVFSLLRRQPDRQFDYIYVAPPQYHSIWVKALEVLDQNPEWSVGDGWVIAQIDPVEYLALDLKHFSEFDQRKYGSTLLVFYERMPSDA